MHIANHIRFREIFLFLIVFSQAVLPKTVGASFMLSSEDEHPCTRLILEEDYVEARLACELDLDNSGPAQRHNLGYFYLTGLGEVNNVELGVALLAEVAATEPHAMNTLAQAYESGTGVEADPAKAWKSAQDSARANNAVGQYTVGRFYEDGIHIVQDSVEARRWFELATEQGHEPAMTRLAILLHNGAGVDRDSARAFKLFKAAAQKGEPQAQFNVGFFFSTELLSRKMTNKRSSGLAWPPHSDLQAPRTTLATCTRAGGVSTKT
jgi:TPR repeat protein